MAARDEANMPKMAEKIGLRISTPLADKANIQDQRVFGSWEDQGRVQSVQDRGVDGNTSSKQTLGC